MLYLALFEGLTNSVKIVSTIWTHSSITNLTKIVVLYNIMMTATNINLLLINQTIYSLAADVLFIPENSSQNISSFKMSVSVPLYASHLYIDAMIIMKLSERSTHAIQKLTSLGRVLKSKCLISSIGDIAKNKNDSR